MVPMTSPCSKVSSAWCLRAIAWIFVAPTIFLLLAINIFPLIWTIRLSFTNYRANRLNREVEWVGLRNYERILTDDGIWMNMQATAHFLFWTIVLQVLIGFTLALASLGAVRELFGNGTLTIWETPIQIFGPSFQPFTFMIEAPGAFVGLGLMLCLMNMLGNK